jgi:C1A family cysteine protease
MAEQKALDLNQLRVELLREGAPWRSVDTTIAMLEEPDRRRLLGVPLPPENEAQRIIQQAEAITSVSGNGNGHGPRAAGNGAGAATGIGAAFDARNVGGTSYVTPIKNQLNCGSCVAFGTLATIETTAGLLRGQPGLQLNLSEQQLFFVHGPATGASCSNGWWPEHAFTACRDMGVTFEDYMPYNPAGGGSLNPDWPNRKAQITGFATHTGNVAAMKQHIQSYGSVSACFIVFQDFFSYGGGVYKHVSGAQAGGHCVSLIGFDDNLGCWIGKNSWGTGWGEQGFFRIGYGECAIETWRVHGSNHVNVRMWLQSVIRGLWSNESADNAHAYLDKVGWSRLAFAAPGANLSMLSELTSARLRNQSVNAFHDNGQITETYVF